jgi:hypothetical protein
MSSTGAARPLPVADLRRLLAGAEPNKTKLVRKSLAEENPVVCTGGGLGAYPVVEGVWRPSPGSASDGTTGARTAECGTMVAVGYDDLRFGGAFEIMNGCATDSDADRFFWVLYNDFDRFCGCAVEVVGRRASGGKAVELSGSVRFQNEAGEPMPMQSDGHLYRLERPYASGARFRVLVTSDGPAYVYVLASDLTRKVYRLFPGDGGSAHLAYRENELAIPNEEEYLQLDERPGTDYFCVLYSTRRLDFSALVRRMERAPGDFSARVQAALGEQSIPQTDVRYALTGDVAFSTRSSRGSVTSILIEIPHAR